MKNPPSEKPPSRAARVVPIPGLLKLPAECLFGGLLEASVPVETYGAPALKAVISFKWEAFVRVFLILQIFDHVVFMVRAGRRRRDRAFCVGESCRGVTLSCCSVVMVWLSLTQLIAQMCVGQCMDVVVLQCGNGVAKPDVVDRAVVCRPMYGRCRVAVWQ